MKMIFRILLGMTFAFNMVACQSNDEKQIENSVVKNDYQITDDLKIHFYSLTYDELISRNDKKELKYSILITKNPYLHCRDDKSLIYHVY